MDWCKHDLQLHLQSATLVVWLISVHHNTAGHFNRCELWLEHPVVIVIQIKEKERLSITTYTLTKLFICQKPTYSVQLYSCLHSFFFTWSSLYRPKHVPRYWQIILCQCLSSDWWSFFSFIFNRCCQKLMQLFCGPPTYEYDNIQSTNLDHKHLHYHLQIQTFLFD